jgi:hypothetical protein
MTTAIKALGIRSPLLRERVLVETIDRGAYIPSRRLFSPLRAVIAGWRCLVLLNPDGRLVARASYRNTRVLELHRQSLQATQHHA